MKLPPMPELPTPNYESAHDDAPLTDHWSERQVRAYAIAYGAAVREECAKRVEAFSDPDDDGWETCLKVCAAAIREEGE